MAKHHTCDLTGDRLIEPELSTLRVSGPLASILNRRELHLGKEAAYDLAEFLHIPAARPEGLESTMAARREAEAERLEAQQAMAAGRTPGIETR